MALNTEAIRHRTEATGVVSKLDRVDKSQISYYSSLICVDVDMISVLTVVRYPPK
jgi:hypothetical protein